MAPALNSDSALAVAAPLRRAAPARARPRAGLSGAAAVAVVLLVVAVVGIADYLTGHEILLSIFYLVPVAIAAWSVGRAFAMITSLLSVGAWVIGDMAAGAVYGRPFVLVWNASITLAFYFVVVVLIGRIRGMQRNLEERVRLRTVALTEEMSERQRLEREILDIGENERRRIGRDLHDSVGQLLTGTALAGQVLKEKLAARELDEVSDLARVVSMVEEAIEQTRSLARGLDPIEMDGLGLVHGLRELVARTSALSSARCEFDSSTDLVVQDRGTAIHLYRIVQEAITNALKHGRAGRIDVSLEEEPGELVLRVTDDGVGLPESHGRFTGMGMRIMAHRAGVIGGTFAARRRPGGGTEIECRVPDA
jgi:signal transduction histidine kinase